MCRRRVKICKRMICRTRSSRTRYAFRWLIYSENQVEVEAHVPVIISEELTVLWVGSVGMYLKRVEMVGDIGD